MFRDRSYPSLLLLGLALAVTATIAVGAGTSSASFNAYNPGWDGTSELRTTVDDSETELQVTQSVNAYNEAPAQATVAVVLSPTEPYENPGRIRQFVESGGTLVVAEDYGSGGNELLDAVGAQARINGTQLRDERNAGPSPAFPTVTPMRNHTYTRNVNSVMLNRGSVVEPGNATTLLHSSQFSYLDRNGNEELDTNETLARYPVMTVEQVGDGRVVAVSDPSIFLNAMLDERDNRALLRNIVGTHSQMLFDLSHTSEIPVAVQLQLLMKRSGIAVVLGGTASVLLLFGLSNARGLTDRLARRRGQSVDRPTLSSEEIAAGIRARHPEWDEQRIQRVTDSLMSYRRQSGTDD